MKIYKKTNALVIEGIGVFPITKVFFMENNGIFHFTALTANVDRFKEYSITWGQIQDRLGNSFISQVDARAYLTGLISSEIVSINSVHDNIHKGLFFTGGHYIASLANDASLDLLIQNGATNTHMDFYESVGGDSIIMLYEGVTFSNAGTDVTVSNHNRKSANAFIGTITHTPTITGLGNQINSTVFSAGGTGGNAQGGSFDGFSNEFVLKENTNYLLRATNVSGQARKASMKVSFYQLEI